MASVVMADASIPFDGAMAEAGPLGGAETAFVALAEALAARGHQVEVRNLCKAPITHKDVSWAPLATAMPDACDLYIGNRGHRTDRACAPDRGIECCGCITRRAI